MKRGEQSGSPLHGVSNLLDEVGHEVDQQIFADSHQGYGGLGTRVDLQLESIKTL